MKVKNKGPQGTSLMSVTGTYFINKFKLSVATHLQYVAHKSDLLKRLSFLVFSLPLPWANRTRKIWCRGLPHPPTTTVSAPRPCTAARTLGISLRFDSRAWGSQAGLALKRKQYVQGSLRARCLWSGLRWTSGPAGGVMMDKRETKWGREGRGGVKRWEENKAQLGCLALLLWRFTFLSCVQRTFL